MSHKKHYVNYGVLGGGALNFLSSGQLAANPWGLFDVHGNVNEKVHDIYASNDADAADLVDPVGDDRPVGQRNRVRGFRGGSYIESAAHSRSAARNYGNPNDRNSNVGLRLVRSLGQ